MALFGVCSLTLIKELHFHVSRIKDVGDANDAFVRFILRNELLGAEVSALVSGKSAFITVSTCGGGPERVRTSPSRLVPTGHISLLKHNEPDETAGM